MPVRLNAPLALSALVLSFGCYESFPGTPRDGAVVLGDGGDGGGPVVSPDAFVPRPDAGMRPSPCTSGEIVAAYVGPGCSGTTAACLSTCTAPEAPPTCTADCIDRDPECRMCVNETIVACGNREGCQTAWNAFACCAQQRCPEVRGGADRLACASAGQCLVELEAYFLCLDGGPLAACNAEVQQCFAP